MQLSMILILKKKGKEKLPFNKCFLFGSQQFYNMNHLEIIKWGLGPIQILLKVYKHSNPTRTGTLLQFPTTWEASIRGIEAWGKPRQALSQQKRQAQWHALCGRCR
jgi:hypothetical protein